MTRWKFESKWIKYVGGAIGGIVAGFIMMVGATKIVYPAISELVGLSVATSATTWNSVIDAAKGDSIGNGVLGQSPYLWNGVTFDRQRGSITNGALVDVSRLNGTITSADAYANQTTLVQAMTLPEIFNGSTWDRVRSASSTNNTQTTVLGAQQVAQLGTWSITNSANAGTPSASKASGGGSVRHVAVCVSVSVAAAATAQPAVQVNLRDGGTGAGTIVRSWQFAAPANDSAQIDLCGLNITGSAATAMTIEFAGATAANTQASVNLSGYSTP
jgi:hypothetical protein